MTYMPKLSGPIKTLLALFFLLGMARAQTGLANYPASSLGGSPGNVSGPLLGNGASIPSAATSHDHSAIANCIAASGSGTAYTCSTSPTFVPASGDHIQFKADVANTGSATLAVNGASATVMYKWGNSSTLIANDVLAGHWISETYDGTHWQLEGQLGNANATQVNGATVPASASFLASNSSYQVVAAAYTPANCTAGTTGSDCLTLTSGLVSVANLPAATASAKGAVQLSTAGGAAQVIANGTAALGTSTISSGACASAVTATATNTATTDVIGWGFNGDPTGILGYEPATTGMLTIISYTTSGNVNFKVCNNTAASITPGAITLNWHVNR